MRAVDEGLLVFLAVLLLLPLVSEVEAVGVRVRRQIEAVRDDLSRQITTLKAEVQTSVGIQNQISLPFPLTSPEALEQLRKALEREAPGTLTESVPEVPDDAKFLFSVRYRLESEVKRIFPDVENVPRRRRFSTPQLVLRLADVGYLPREAANVFREIWGIASRAIHGNQLDQRYVKFARDSFPHLLELLRKVPTFDGGFEELDDG